MHVQVLCDSASDLNHDVLERQSVRSLPLKVILNGEEYEDGIGMAPSDVYSRMRNGQAPKTAQVSPQAFRDMFTHYAEKGQPFIYFALSSELSGTYQTAKMVEQEVKEAYENAQFDVIDTKAASLGYGLVVWRASELAKEGGSYKDILELGQYHAAHMEHIFTVDDLEYLQRGGRVSRTAAFVGGLLKIKPLLHMEEGKLIPLEKIRGSKKVLKRMLEVMDERGKDLKNQRMAISHGDDQERAEKLAEMIKEKYGTEEIHIDFVGATIGAHAGPGTIALFFLNDTYK
ncbi:EDD domain protein, DegV family [Halobacillus karajensis]|uniref:Fatty acid-binding protein n=1 Tax=Halobacillus karajensis TaxID=195088 RepID=A0A024P831_9BACI|nr:DegV family protein [Halobacillus karajensis]CDQ21055.1 Fatty acid-binding protein [Halobacillus karajensis]CDQ24881.1 Fatty acid-binding protein [Halobacillus karajensis]CDQ28759.1 Fatty acid-binding protein [Halobacillus karajensis]SEH96854.1 EDD domain protein, DegV family [Halobacillus karajensis]